MNRTLMFTSIGLLLGSIVGVTGAYFDNSGAADQKVFSMIFCGVCGAFVLGLLGFAIAKVDNSGTSKPKTVTAKRDPKTQFGIEFAGACGLIALSASNLYKISENPRRVRSERLWEASFS